METFITPQDDFENGDQPLPSNVFVVHFKMVSVGPNTMKACQYIPSNIHNAVVQQPGFYVLSENVNGLRAAMHDLVDRFCDLQAEELK